MSIWKTLIVAFAISLSQFAFAQSTPDPADMRTYFDQIRRLGISEDAQSSIESVASLTSGAFIVTYQKDATSGSYFPSYRSTVCALPGDDSTVKSNAKGEARLRVSNESLRLKELADIDSSGFVSTNEGRAFRDLVEFAFALGQVSILEGHDIQKICGGLRLTRKEVEKKKNEYRLLLVRAKQLGIMGLPELM